MWPSFNQSDDLNLWMGVTADNLKNVKRKCACGGAVQTAIVSKYGVIDLTQNKILSSFHTSQFQ